MFAGALGSAWECLGTLESSGPWECLGTLERLGAIRAAALSVGVLSAATGVGMARQPP